MPATTVLLAVLVASMTAAVVLWVASLRFLHATGGIPRAALVPVLTPIHAWRGGARYLPVTFVLAVVVYALGWVVWTGTGVP